MTPVAAAWAPLPDAFFARPAGRAAGPRALLSALRTPRDRRRDTPLPCFLLEHPDAGAIMVDCGPAPGPPRDDLGLPFGLVFRYDERDGVLAQLAAAGVSPQDVGTVVVTHSHYDHLGGSRSFPAARFVVHADEDADRASPLKGTWAKHRVAAARWDPVALDGGPHGPFDRSLDLLGDGTVVLVATPGHTPGHVSVLLRLADGRDALLTADAAYRRETIDRREVPLLCPDVEEYLRSLDRIRAWVDAHPGAVVVCGHDALGWPVAVRELAGSAA